MKNIQNKLFLSCVIVTELIEKNKVIGLSLSEKIRMKIHLSMCKACLAYVHQSDTIDAMFKRWENIVDEERILTSQKALFKKLQGLK